MDYGLIFTVGFFLFGGLWALRDGVKQLRLHQYLRKHGILVSAVITEAQLIRGNDRWGKEGLISHFKVTYQDAQNHSYDVDFSAKNSDDEYLYLVGGEVSIYYDPLRPENSILAIYINLSWRCYEIIFTGALLIALGFFLIWKSLS